MNISEGLFSPFIYIIELLHIPSVVYKQASVICIILSVMCSRLLSSLPQSSAVISAVSVDPQPPELFNCCLDTMTNITQFPLSAASLLPDRCVITVVLLC